MPKANSLVNQGKWRLASRLGPISANLACICCLVFDWSIAVISRDAIGPLQCAQATRDNSSVTPDKPEHNGNPLDNLRILPFAIFYGRFSISREFSISRREILIFTKIRDSPGQSGRVGNPVYVYNYS